MIAADFTEVTLIDEAITDLQLQLADLYNRRKSILHPAAVTRKNSVTTPRINLETLDLSLSSHPSLSLQKSTPRK